MGCATSNLSYRLLFRPYGREFFSGTQTSLEEQKKRRKDPDEAGEEEKREKREEREEEEEVEEWERENVNPGGRGGGRW